MLPRMQLIEEPLWQTKNFSSWTKEWLAPEENCVNYYSIKKYAISNNNNNNNNIQYLYCAFFIKILKSALQYYQ